MIQEQYVTLDIARLLREKGFDEPCFAYYSEYWDDWKTLRFWRKGRRNVPNKGYLNAPTQSLVMKWLRKNHNLFIEPSVGVTGDKWWYDFDIIPVNGRDIKWNHYTEMPVVEYGSLEEAIEAAIKYCLENLI